jgi:hypothetical protein
VAAIKEAHMKVLHSLTASVLLLAGHSALADEGSAVNAMIQRMQMTKTMGNMVFIQLATPPAVRANCATNGLWHFILIIDNEVSKNMYAQLLTAYASGQPVDIGGTGLCSWGTVEDVNGIALRGS